MHTDEPDEENEGEDVEQFRKVVNRRFSKMNPQQTEQLHRQNKELALDSKVRSMHCRPLDKMFKFFNSDEMMAVATPDFDELQYTEITRVQLNEFKAKL